MPNLNKKAQIIAGILMFQHLIILMLFGDYLTTEQFWASLCLSIIGLTMIALPNLPLWKIPASK